MLVISSGYDANGNATSTRNALGDVLTVEFDALNRAVAQVDPDSGRTVTTYDAVGRTLAETDPNGATKNYSYDALGRLTSSTDGEGFATTSEYDAVGNVLSVTDPRGGVVASTYDVVNRQVTVTDAVGATATSMYDAAGKVVATTDPEGVIKKYTYDSRGLLTATTENSVAGEEPSASVNVTTSTDYDARGLATSITDPRGNVTTYAHDALGRVTDETNPLGQTSSTQFDALGRPAAVTAADGSVTTTSYTADGYVSALTYPDKTVANTYDAVGNRLTMVDNVGTSSWVYDWAGRITSETDARGNTQTHTFDAVGNELATGYSDGRTVTRGFDGRNLPVTQTDLTGTTEYSYDAAGLLSKVALASGVTTSVERDAVGRVTTLDHIGTEDEAAGWPSPCLRRPESSRWNSWWHKDSEPMSISLDYTYDSRGLVSARDLTADGSHDVTTYLHDALGRLVESSSAADVVTYGWDAASNLVSEAHTNDTSTHRPRDGYVVTREVNAANQLVGSVRSATSHGHQPLVMSSFTYDERGNRVSETTREGSLRWSRLTDRTEFTYDGRDDVVAVRDSDGKAWWRGDGDTTRFVRDGLGRALSVVQDGHTTDRLYAGLDVVAEGDTQVVRDPFGAVQSEVTTSWDGGRWWRHQVTKEQDVLKDLLGSPVGVAVDGVVSKDLQVFGDFGDVVDSASWSTVTGFTGKVSTDGLIEFATRTYDPSSRVWLQEDSYRGTTTRAASLNRYAYVEGAPESFVDVLGFFRAAAAIRAQALAAAQAAYDAALKAYNAVVSEQARAYDTYLSHAHQQARLFAREMGQIQAQAAAQQASAAWARAQAAQAVAAAQQARSKKNWWDRTVGAVVNTVSSVVTAQAGGSKCSSIAGLNYWAFTGGVSCDASQAQYYESDPLADAAEWSAAFGDTVTFGGTEQIRRLINYEQGNGNVDMVDHNTLSYDWGGNGGVIANTGLVVIGGAGLVKSLFGRLEQGLATTALAETGSLVPAVAEGALAAEATTSVTGSAVRATTTTAADSGLSGPVTFRPPPQATADEIAQVRAYVDGCNAALCAGELSPSGRVSTQGAMRADASRAAAVERARAAAAETPYVGNVGHVPDTTWTGSAVPSSWMDLAPRVNSSLGGQAVRYPIGYRPTVFRFEE